MDEDTLCECGHQLAAHNETEGYCQVHTCLCGAFKVDDLSVYEDAYDAGML